MSEEDLPELAIALVIAGPAIDAIEGIASRRKVSVTRWRNGWAAAEVYSRKLALGPEAERQAAVEEAAQELVGVFYEFVKGVDRSVAVPLIELRLTIFATDSMNADFYVPHVLTDAIHKHAIELYLGAL